MSSSPVGRDASLSARLAPHVQPWGAVAVEGMPGLADAGAAVAGTAASIAVLIADTHSWSQVVALHLP